MEEPIKKELDAQTVISMRHQGSYDGIGAVYHGLHEWAGQHGVKTEGKGFTVFLGSPNEFDWESALFEVCIPVGSESEGDSQVTVKNLPACTVASVEVKGPYSDISARYTEMLAWLSEKGWEVAGSPREVYIKRPSKRGGEDPNEFVTEIQFPIRHV